MLKKFENLPLRDGVGIIVINNDNKIFVAKRIDNPKNYWQMPQGGVDSGENYYQAALRELEEETSIKNIEFVKEIEGYISYELPDYLLGIIWKGKFKGQKQKWFLFKLKENTKISFENDPDNEFENFKWVSYWYPLAVIVSFKEDVYRKALNELKYAYCSEFGDV